MDETLDRILHVSPLPDEYWRSRVDEALELLQWWRCPSCGGELQRVYDNGISTRHCRDCG